MSIPTNDPNIYHRVSPPSISGPSQKKAAPPLPSQPQKRAASTSLLQENIYKTAPKKKTLNMFCHEVATGLAYGTKHEGSTIPESTGEFLYGLQRTEELANFLGLDNTLSLPKLMDPPPSAIRVPHDATPLLNSEIGKANNYAHCCEQINNLEIGQSCVIRLSLIARKSGHAINIIVRRDGKDSYDFTIVNTGAGLHYHKQMKEGDKTKFLSTMSIQGLSLQHISDPVLWGRLGQASVDGVYSIAEHHLSKYGVKQEIDRFEPALFVSEQQAGICGMQVMLDTVRQLILTKTLSEGLPMSVAYERYKTFSLLYKMQSMMNMADTYLTNGEYDRETHSLILDSIGALSKRIDKVNKNGILSEESSERLTATLEDIREKVKDLKASREIPPSEKFAPHTATKTHDENGSYRLQNIARIQEQGDPFQEIDPKLLFESKLKPFSGGLTKDNVFQYLKAIEEILDNPPPGINIHDKKIAAFFALELLKAFPLPGKPPSFVEQFTGEEAERLAVRLIEMHDKVIANIGTINEMIYGDRKAGYQGFLLGQKLFSLCDYLFKQSSPERKKYLETIGSYNQGLKNLGRKFFDPPTNEEQIYVTEITKYQQALESDGEKYCNLLQTQICEFDDYDYLTVIPPLLSQVLDLKPGEKIRSQEFQERLQKAVNPRLLKGAEHQTNLFVSSHLFSLMVKNAQLLAASLGKEQLEGGVPAFTQGKSYIREKNEISVDLVLENGIDTILMRRHLENLEIGYYLDTNLVKKMDEITKPKNYAEVNTLLTNAIALLPNEELQNPTQGIIAARCVIEQLRKLPPPNDPLWLTIYDEQELIELGENLVNIQKQLALVMKSYGQRRKKFHHGVGGLASSLLLTQLHLTCLLFEVLKAQRGSPLKNRCLSLPELEWIKSSFLEMEGARDFHLCDSLQRYLNEGLYTADECNTPIFILDPDTEDKSTYEHLYNLAHPGKGGVFSSFSGEEKEQFYTNFGEDYEHLDHLRRVRYYTTMAASHCHSEISSFSKLKEDQGMEDVKFEVSKWGKLELKDSEKVRKKLEGAGSQERETRTMNTTLWKKPHEIEMYRIKEEMSSALYGNEGSALLYLERLFKHYTLNIDALSAEDVHRIGGLLFSDTYLISQIKSSKELYDLIHNELRKLQESFRNRELADRELAAIYLRIKFMSICGGEEVRTGLYQSVKQHALNAVSHLTLPKDKARALALRMYTLLQLPKEHWGDNEKLDFYSDYLTFRYLTGQQGYPGLLDIDPSVYYLYQMAHSEFIKNLADPNSKLPKKLMEAIPKRLELNYFIDKENGRRELCISKDDPIEIIDGIYYQRRNFYDRNNPKEILHSDLITFNPQKMEILLNGRCPARDQAGERDKLRETLKGKLGKAIVSIEPDQSGGYRALDQFGRQYYVTVNRLINPKTGFYELESYNVTTQVEGEDYFLIINDPECKAVEEFAEKNSHASPVCLFAPKDSSKPILIFANGFPSLMIEKKNGAYDWRNLAPIGKPQERLADISWIESKEISGLIGALGGVKKAVAWNDNSNNLKRLEFKDIELILDVQNDVNGKKRLYVRGSQGFFIAENQDTRLREHFPGMILLQNDKGEEKLLVAKIETTPQDDVEKSYKKNLSPLSLFSPASPKAYYLLEIKDVYGERAIIPRNYSEALYFCEHCVQQQQYKLARYYLNCISAVNEPSREDMARMERIFMTLYHHKTPTARALALSFAAQELRFLHLFQRNKSDKNLNQPTITGSHKEELMTLYQLYKRFRKPWPHLDISPEDLQLLENTIHFSLDGVQVAVERIEPTSGVDCLKSLSIDQEVLKELKDSLSQDNFEDVEEFLNSVDWDTEKIFKSSFLWKILIYLEKHPKASQKLIERITIHRCRFPTSRKALLEAGKKEAGAIDRNLQGAYIIDLIYRAALPSKKQGLTLSFIEEAWKIQNNYEKELGQLQEEQRKQLADLNLKKDQELAKFGPSKPKSAQQGWNFSFEQFSASGDAKRKIEMDFQRREAELAAAFHAQLKAMEENRQKAIENKFRVLGDLLSNQVIDYKRKNSSDQALIKREISTPKAVKSSSSSTRQIVPNLLNDKSNQEILVHFEKVHKSNLDALEQQFDKSREKVKYVSEEANRMAASMQDQIDNLSRKILEDADQLPRGQREEVRRRILRREKSGLNLESLINAWRFASSKEYSKLTYLDRDQIRELDKMLYAFMILSSGQMELVRLAENLEKQSLQMEKNEESELTEQAFRQLKAQFRGAAYVQDFSLRARMFLHFEQKNNLRIREKQIDFMDKFISLYQKGLIRVNSTTAEIEWIDRTDQISRTEADREIFRELVAQLGTGSGKSKVLTPLILNALIFLESVKTDSPSLVGSIWPEKLYLTNVSDTSHSMKEGFGTQSIVFEITRETNFSNPIAAETILHEIRQAKLQGKVVNVHPLANRSLLLNHILLLEKINLNKQEIEALTQNAPKQMNKEEQAKMNKSMDRLIDEQKRLTRAVEVSMELEAIFSTGNFTNDESHETQNPITGNLKYAYGNRVALPLPHQKMAARIFNTLLLDDDINKLLRISENKHKEILMENPGLYHEEVAPKLAVTALTSLEKKEPRLIPHRKELIAYLTGSAKEKPAILESLSKERQEELYLCKGLIADELPNALRGAVNKDYGFSKLTPNPIQAIPYKAADQPNEGSEFEIINYTVAVSAITMAVQGVTADQVKEIASDLYGIAMLEARAKNIPLNQTKAWNNVRNLFGEITEKRLLDLANGDPVSEIGDSARTFALRRSSYYFKRYALGKIRFYEKTLSTNPQTQKELLGTLTHLSATPGAVAMYSQSALYTHDTESERLVRKTLCTKVENSSVEIFPDMDSYGYLASLASQMARQENAYLLVDAGAWLKGIPPEKVAKRLLDEVRKTRKDIEAVQFFKGDAIYVVSIDKPYPVPLELSTAPMERCLCYCDNSHLFGADFVLPDRAMGVVTLAGDMSTDTLFQAVGRLRKLQEEQTLHFGVPHSMLAKMKAFPHEKGIESILSLTDANAERERLQKNFISMQQQIQGIVFGPLFAKLQQMPLSEQLRMFKELESELIKPNSESLEKMYGAAQPNRDTAAILHEHLKEACLVFDKIAKKKFLTSSEENSIMQALEACPGVISKMIDQGELPRMQDTMKLQNAMQAEAEASAASESQAQAEAQSQQQQQAALEKSQGNFGQIEPLPIWSKSYDLFCDKWLPGLKVDMSQKAKEKKIEAFAVYKEEEKSVQIGRLGEIYQKNIGDYVEEREKFGAHRDEKYIAEVGSKVRQGWFGLIAKTVGSLGLYPLGYLVYDLFSPKHTVLKIRHLENPEPVDCASSQQEAEMRIENYLAQGKGDFKLRLQELGGKRDVNLSSHELMRRELGRSYTNTVHTFFHTTKGVHVNSHVSPSVWSPEADVSNGAFSQIQIPFDRYLVIIEENSKGQHEIHTVMGAADDLAHWEKVLQKDRERFGNETPERTRKIELWSVSNGVIERCALGRKKREPNPAIDDALLWEQIKWKVLNGNFQLNEQEMKIFKERFEALAPKEQFEIIAFMDNLAETGQTLDGKKSQQYSKDDFLMGYLNKFRP